MKSKTYYNRYDHFLKIDPARVESFRTIKKWLKSKKKVLDVGCGVGYLTSYWQAIGIDSSQKAIRTAQQKYPHTKFIKGSAAKLPFANRSIDAIVAYNLLEHLSCQDRSKFFDQAKRVLKKNGIFIAAYIDETFWFNRWLAAILPDYGIKDHTHKVSWSPDDFKKEVARHFKIIKTKQTSQYGKLIFITKYLKGESLVLAEQR